VQEDSISENELLHGKALQIYWYLLTKGESGIRDIQRNLHFNSPSLVHYQINKLVSRGLVHQNESTEKYFIEEPLKTGIFSFYIFLGKKLIPRFVFYLSFLIMGLFIYAFIILSRDPFFFYLEDFLFLTFNILGLVFFSFEGYNLNKLKPKLPFNSSTSNDEKIYS